MELTPPNPWIVCFKPKPSAKLRLFCFPYAGGSAPIFRRWADNLPNEIEVCAIQAPGRWGRMTEPPFTKLEPFVEDLYKNMLPYLEKPFAFFGHSLGGLIAFELCRRLQGTQGVGPRLLGVSACGAPQLPRPNPKQIHKLPDEDFLQELKRLKGTPQEIFEHSELVKMFLPLLRADLGVFETYTYRDEAPLNCSILSLGGEEDEEVSQQGYEGWRDQTTGSFSFQMFPGGHFFIQTHSSLVIERLRKELALILENLD